MRRSFPQIGTIRPDPSAGDASIRDAAAGGADVLLAILQRLGDQSAHPELKDAPTPPSGGSAGAGFGTTFVGLYPQRAVAFIRYHVHLRGRSPDAQVLKDIPAPLIAGGKDETAGTEDRADSGSTGGQRACRGHSLSSPVRRIETNRPWCPARSLSSVGRSRSPSASPTRQHAIAADNEDSGGLGTNRGCAVRDFSGFERQESWLPDEATARGWRTVSGAAR